MASLISSNASRITVNRQGGATIAFVARDPSKNIEPLDGYNLRFIAGDDLFEVDLIADPDPASHAKLIVITKAQVNLLPDLGLPFVIVDADAQDTTQPWLDGRIVPEAE